LLAAPANNKGKEAEGGTVGAFAGNISSSISTLATDSVGKVAKGNIKKAAKSTAAASGGASGAAAIPEVAAVVDLVVLGAMYAARAVRVQQSRELWRVLGELEQVEAARSELVSLAGHQGPRTGAGTAVYMEQDVLDDGHPVTNYPDLVHPVGSQPDGSHLVVGPAVTNQYTNISISTVEGGGNPSQNFFSTSGINSSGYWQFEE
jgi:hypothetical protein